MRKFLRRRLPRARQQPPPAAPPPAPPPASLANTHYDRKFHQLRGKRSRSVTKSHTHKIYLLSPLPLAEKIAEAFVARVSVSWEAPRTPCLSTAASCHASLGWQRCLPPPPPARMLFCSPSCMCYSFVFLCFLSLRTTREASPVAAWTGRADT